MYQEPASKSLIEKKRRIQGAVWAWSYEKYGHSLVSDQKFDDTCYAIDLSVATDRPDLDKWFRKNFDPCTGMWIYRHPELTRIDEIVRGILEEETQ